MTYSRTVECSTYPFRSLAPQFEQSILHGARVGHAKINTAIFEHFDKSKEICIYADWPFFDLPLHAIIEVKHSPHERRVSTLANSRPAPDC